jgi:alpha-tubulin suppressor-like RCC1 family protein
VSPFSSPEPSPGLVLGGHAFVDLTVGSMHACGIDAAGAAWCWGRNDDGELGLGTRGGSHSLPEAVIGGHAFTRLSAGWVFTCGVDAAGAGLCWGVNQAGQLGRGFAGSAAQPTPDLVVGGHTWESIRAGWRHACGVTPTGETWCWGLGSSGQLGQGSTTGTSVPVFTIDLDPASSP